MTIPRRHVPGQVAMCQRRTACRMFLLRPDRAMGRLFAFLIAHLAPKFDIGIVACMVMSNHYHIVLVDRHGKRSDFFERLNSLVARARNVSLKRVGEDFWGPGSYKDNQLLDHPTVADKAM